MSANKSISLRRLMAVMLCVGAPVPMMSQTMIYLERCALLSYDEQRLPGAQVLQGDVCFRHDSALMYCDSAYFYEATNSFDAFGHVRFEQGDTLHGYGDVLYYDGNTKIARLRRHVRLVHRTTVLTTDSLNYDRNKNLAYYMQTGVIEDEPNSLHSVWGEYNPASCDAIFRHEVHLENPSFTLDADLLKYNTKTNIAHLIAPTTIVYEGETTILSSNGWYNTVTEQSMLLDNSQIIHIDGKQLTGDTIYYDKKKGIGNVFGHMLMSDTVQRLTLQGDYGIMYEQQKSGWATGRALAIDSSQTNPTFIHADTLFTEQIPYVDTVLIARDSIMVDSVLTARAPDTLLVDTAYRRLRAYYHVRAYNVDYQLICDSMSYEGKDSVVTLLGEPVCWSDQNQISADTIYVYIRNATVDYAHGIGSALGIKQEEVNCFDQLSGKQMKAFIRDGELREVDVNGNAETVFYPREEDSTFVGVNKSQSSCVMMFLENNRVHHVLFTTTTTGTLYPLDQIEPKDTRLAGFFWAIAERPTSPMDVFSCPPRTVRPDQKAVSATEEEDAEEEKPREHIQRNKKKAGTTN